jgi:isocitrate dehydrogenase
MTFGTILEKKSAKPVKVQVVIGINIDDIYDSVEYDLKGKTDEQMKEIILQRILKDINAIKSSESDYSLFVDSYDEDDISDAVKQTLEYAAGKIQE